MIHAELTPDGERIVLTGSGSYEAMAQHGYSLRTLTPLVKKTDPAGGVYLPTSWAAVVQLMATFSNEWVPGERLCDWITEEITRRTASLPDELGLPIPQGMTPYPWQVSGAHMIATLGKALITDDPGTGKTLTTVLGLLLRALSGTWPFPALVVCPASVVDPWVDTWRQWAPDLNAATWRGPRAQRRALARVSADVYVSSYDTARMDAEQLGKLGFQSVVIDECHFVKNPNALRSQVVRRLAKPVGTVVALSGTPITHNPADLWPTLVALEPVAWPSRERWISRYCQTLPGDYNESIGGLLPYREPEFRTTLQGQMRRIAKADVLEQLPPKVYSTRTVELPPKWRTAYDAMQKQMLAELPNGEELSVMSVLAQLTRLSQLASAPADVQVITEQVGESLVESVRVRLEAPSWKVDALLEILEERPGEPVVAFAPSRQLVVLAGEAAEKAGYRVGYIVGGQSMRERTETIAEFQGGKLDLICVTTQAGGTGITLTASRTCVFLQRPWSLTDAIQAEDRLHRIGAERHESIEVIDVVARNTIDTKIRVALKRKAGQLADIVQDPRIVAELLGGVS